MGQLTNQYVSQSYQGLLNLNNANTGLTANLQTVTDGLGGSSPLQISQTQVNISGTFTINGSPITGTDTGSLMKTGSVAGDTLTFTKGDGSQFSLQVSVATGSLPAGVVSGSQQIIDLGFLETGSFNSYTSSNDSKVNSLIASTGSYATTSSLTSLSQSIATTDLGQDNRLGSLESATSSLQNQINQKLDTGSFNSYTSSNDTKVNDLISKTGSYVTETESGSFVTNVQQGIINSIVEVTKGDGTTSQFTVDNVISSSFADSATSASWAPQPDVSYFATTGSNDFVGQQNINGSVNVTGSLNVTGEVTALSASITYLKTIYQTSSVIFTSGSNILGDEAGDTQTLYGTVRLPNGPLSVTGSATVSGASTFGGNVLVSGSNSISLRVSSSLANGGITTITPLSVVASSGSYSSTLGKTNILSSDSTGAPTTNRLVGLAANPSLLGAPSVAGVTSPSILGMNGSSQPEALISFQYRGAYTDGRISILKNTDLTGSLTVTNGITGSLEGTASYATNALSSSFAQNAISSSHAINADTASYINNSTLEQNLNINGMLNVTGALTASGLIYPTVDGSTDMFLTTDGGGNLSFDWVKTLHQNIHNAETSSIVRGTPLYVSGATGDNANVYIADAADPNRRPATLIAYDATLAPSATGTGIISGEIEGVDTNLYPAGTIVYLAAGGGWTATRPTGSNISVQSLGVVTRQDNNGRGVVFNQIANNLPNIQEGYVWVGDSNSYPVAVSTSSFIEDLSMYATTGSNTFKGDQTITGSLTVRSGSVSSVSNNTTIAIENYVTNSLGGQANIIKGWGENPGLGGPGGNQANYTGSINITGSNNIISLPQLRATGFGGTTGHVGYISGSDNMIMSNFAGIYLNTGSQLLPKVQNNILGNGSSIVMNFTTSSLAGSHPFITNNFIQGGSVVLNSNSGSITSFGTNIINGGAVFSTQNFTTNVRTLITQNNINNSVTLNHISSSVTYQSNISTSPITINNHVSSSGIANNSVSFANNTILGGSSNNGVNIWVSGSQSSNATRLITDNLIGGRSGIISSSFVSSSNSNLISSLMYGQNLIVSGNHSSSGGSAFLGRFNDATSLHLAQDIVFAVGTGTGTGARRTGLYVTSGSLVGVSGSLDVKGTSTFTGSVNVIGNTTLSGSSPLQVGTSNNVGVIKTLGGSNWLYRSVDDYNTIIGNVQGLNGGFFAGSEKNMVLNGFFSPFATGSNNVIIQGAGDDFISGSGNIFIGSHNSHAGGSNNILLGATSYSSGSIFNDKFELGTNASSRIFHKQGTDPLQIGDDTQVTGSVSISNVMNLKPLDPLPAGNIGDLAVSSSNQLYFYNGAWTLVI